jgi:hypothetical protein
VSIEYGESWRERAGRIILDPFDAHGVPVAAPADRRRLWRIESTLAVSATSDEQQHSAERAPERKPRARVARGICGGRQVNHQCGHEVPSWQSTSRSACGDRACFRHFGHPAIMPDSQTRRGARRAA